MSRAQAMHSGAPRTNTRRVNKAEQQQRRKALMHKVKVVTATALTATFVASSLTLLNRTLQVTTWEIDIQGQTHTSTPHQLKQQMDRTMQSLESYDFWSTRPGVLRSHLLAEVPDLEEVEIQRALGGKLQLHAIPRTPIGLWQTGDKKIELVDIHGTAYRALEASDMADMPILRLTSHDIHQAAQLLQIMRSSQPERFTKISELSTDSRNWKINFTQGQQWMISRNTDISAAINRIGTLLEQPRWRVGHWRIDARAESRCFIRPTSQEGVI